jgi:GntR family transcriptional regulator
MEPEATTTLPPIKVQIADDIRMQIERGDLQPGDPLPALHELADGWECSITSARDAVDLLKQQGLITGGRGKVPVVRPRHRRVVRDSARHQLEKDLAAAPEDVRRQHGEAEDDLGDSIRDLNFSTDYSEIQAGPKLAEVFSCSPEEFLLQKRYETSDKRGTRLAYSVAYVPVRLIEGNQELFDAGHEPWPGGAQHQFRTVGIEIGKMVDEVTSSMPTTADVQRWKLDAGVPMIHVRRISIDTSGHVVEVSDAQYPADRTKLRFTTPLKLWGEN